MQVGKGGLSRQGVCVCVFVCVWLVICICRLEAFGDVEEGIQAAAPVFAPSLSLQDSEGFFLISQKTVTLSLSFRWGGVRLFVLILLLICMYDFTASRCEKPFPSSDSIHARSKTLYTKKSYRLLS